MTKQLFLCLMAGTLVIAPGCTKRTKLTLERETTEEQLSHEAERKKYKTRGIVLTATAPLGILYGVSMTGVGVHLPEAPGILFGGVVLLGVSTFLLGQGIHDLAKAKKLRRIQMKEAAQKRKLEHAIQQA